MGSGSWAPAAPAMRAESKQSNKDMHEASRVMGRRELARLRDGHRIFVGYHLGKSMSHEIQPKQNKRKTSAKKAEKKHKWRGEEVL